MEIESQLMLNKTDFILLSKLTEKGKKNQLGVMFNCTLKNQPDFVCRKMDFERLTQYQIESYFTKLAQIFTLNLSKYVLFARGVYIDKNNSFHLI